MIALKVGAGLIAALLLTLLVGAALVPAQQLQDITYVLAAPLSLPAFLPVIVAEENGFFKEAGFRVKFVVGKGGVDAFKQVGAKNAEFGLGIGDTAIVTRPEGVPVKAVALLGGHALHFLAARPDSGIKDARDLKGKRIAVMSYGDTSWAIFQAVLGAVGLSKADVSVNAYGPGGMIRAVITNEADALFNPPDFGAAVETALGGANWMQADKYFPSLAQAIGAHDETIKNNPDMVRRFVKASIKGLRWVMDNPADAEKLFISRNSSWDNPDSKKTLHIAVQKYVNEVYPGQRIFGAMDPDKLAKVQDFLFEVGIIRKKSHLEELYTNEFVQ